jgi:arylformamidase
MPEKFIDISVAINESLPVWPSDPAVTMPPQSRIADGAGANITRLGIGTHTGTHVDAEWHFIEDGQRLEALTPDRLIGPCYVADLSHCTTHISAEDLARADIPEDTRRVILKTANSDLWTTSPNQFQKGFIGIAVDGAQWIVEQGFDFVGIDYHSVEPYKAGGATHRTILGAGLIILETVDLRGVEPGHYTLYCLPLRIDGFDGAPCRAVLGLTT